MVHFQHSGIIFMCGFFSKESSTWKKNDGTINDSDLEEVHVTNYFRDTVNSCLADTQLLWTFAVTDKMQIPGEEV